MSREDTYVYCDAYGDGVGLVLMDLGNAVRVKFVRGREGTISDGAYRAATEAEIAEARAAGLTPKSRKVTAT